MKIGIISFWDTMNNYGQVLQCFALQRFLRNLGHDAYHIRYSPRPLTKIERLTSGFNSVFKSICYGELLKNLNSHFSKTKDTFAELGSLQSEEDKLHPRGFDEFRKKYIKFSNKTYDQYSIRETPPEADCYICGSDQIWSSPNEAYMLNFGDKKIKRIAYAASLGGVKYDNNKKVAADFKKKLKRFDIVTCREMDGVEVCRKMGRPDTELVPDPVFLLAKEDYEKIAIRPQEEGYVLLYLLGNPIDLEVQEIFKWATRNDIIIKYVPAQGRVDEYPKVYPNVDEFIGLIMNAKYVITNSFHGMAMSIIFNKQFVVIPVTGQFLRMNDRINTTLSNYNLYDRIFDGNLDKLLIEIEYSDVNKVMTHQADLISSKFLHLV